MPLGQNLWMMVSTEFAVIDGISLSHGVCSWGIFVDVDMLRMILSQCFAYAYGLTDVRVIDPMGLIDCWHCEADSLATFLFTCHISPPCPPRHLAERACAFGATLLTLGICVCLDLPTYTSFLRGTSTHCFRYSPYVYALLLCVA